MTRTLHVCLRSGSMGWGCQEVTVRTDGEPSICELIRRVREPLWTRSVLQVTLHNGIAERAILTVGGLVRTTKAVVEEDVLGGRDAGPRLTAWMVHHAAQVICACMVGADGLTPFRQLKGRKFNTPLTGFGERVCLRDPILERANQFNPRCTPATVVDFDGRFRMVQTIKRANADDRWKVVSPRDPFSVADLESTSADFTCSRGNRGEVNPTAQLWERHPVDALPPDPDMTQSRGGYTSSREISQLMGRQIAARLQSADQWWPCTAPHRRMSDSR